MTQSSQRLLKATLISLALIVLFFVSIPDLSINPLSEKKSEPFVKVSDEYVQQKNDIAVADLNDYAPMFLPTKWNFSGIKPSLPRTSLWEMPESTSTNTKADIVEIIPVETKNQKTTKEMKMSIFMRSAFANFATNQDTPQTEVKEEMSSLIVKNLSDGKNILELKIPQSADDNVINIAEFLLRFSNSVMQPPILRKSSGSENNDKRLLQIIREKINELPDGDFKIIAIP